MGIQYKPTKQKKEKPVKAPKAPKAEKAMKLGSVGTVKPTKAPKPPKAEKAPKMAKAMKFESQKPVQFGKVQDSAKSGSGALRKPVKPGVVVAVFAALTVVIIGILIASFFGDGALFADDTPVVKPETLAITNLPEKLTYYVGDKPVYYGLKAMVTLTNGVSIELKASDCEISGFDSSAPADKQTISVKYKDLLATFDVVIQALPDVPSVPAGSPCGLSFKTLPKTQYKVGEYLNVSGGILLLHYDDNTTKEIELDYSHIVNTFDNNVPGEYTIIVRYYDSDHDYLAETTYTITVTE